MKEFKLDKEPQITSGFTIPDNYFDNFSEKVMLKLSKNEPKVVSIWSKNIKWIYAIAAILVISLSILFTNFYQVNSNKASNAAIENYLSYNSTITDDDIVELLDYEDLTKLNILTNIEDKEVEDLLTENINIEQYITN